MQNRNLKSGFDNEEASPASLLHRPLIPVKRMPFVLALPAAPAVKMICTFVLACLIALASFFVGRSSVMTQTPTLQENVQKNDPSSREKARASASAKERSIPAQRIVPAEKTSEPDTVLPPPKQIPETRIVEVAPPRVVNSKETATVTQVSIPLRDVSALWEWIGGCVCAASCSVAAGAPFC